MITTSVVKFGASSLESTLTFVYCKILTRVCYPILNVCLYSIIPEEISMKFVPNEFV